MKTIILRSLLQLVVYLLTFEMSQIIYDHSETGINERNPKYLVLYLHFSIQPLDLYHKKCSKIQPYRPHHKLAQYSYFLAFFFHSKHEGNIFKNREYISVPCVACKKHRIRLKYFESRISLMSL